MKAHAFLLVVLSAAAVSAADRRYLKYSPERYREMVPRHVAAPVALEAAPFATSGNNDRTCPFCGKNGNRFAYDFLANPDGMSCAVTGKDILSFADGKDSFTDWDGVTYARTFYNSPYLKCKVYPENLLAQARITALLGRFSGGALPLLAEGYAETKDEAYAERAIAILEGFADVFPSWPWTGHSATKPLTRAKMDACIARHESGYHGWQGPTRLAAGVVTFPNPEEAIYFTNLVRAYRKLENSPSWRGRKEKVIERLFREGARHFHAYGAKQCVYNAIGMYAPALYELGSVLDDRYLLDGFHRIMEDFLYNENYYDGLSTEGSPDYAGMVSGMWSVFANTGLSSNAAYVARHPFLRHAGRTRARLAVSRGAMPALGDQHVKQYEIVRPAPRETKVGEEFGGWGLSVVRAGSADRRMEIYFSHDRCAGHNHDDMLGLQFFYRGVPMLEQFGDTRGTLDLDDKVPNAEEIAKFAYPAPFVRKDARPRGFSLQDMTTGLTKNLVLVDDYWAGNGWYAAYRGGQGVSRCAPYGRLNVRTGRSPEAPFQFVEAEGVDMNTKSYQGVDVYRRSLCAVTRPDGTPYLVDLFSVAGGHRHLLLLHSRGKEILSTLGHGRTYAHLEDLPSEPVAESFIFSAGSVLFPSNVFNNVDLGGPVKGSWRHSWEFDYLGWASKTHPPKEENRIGPQVLSVHGFLSPLNDARALRADGHYPLTIEERLGKGGNVKTRFQFENAVHYAGLRSESRMTLKDTYVQVYSCRSADEPETFAAVARLPADDGGLFRSAAVALRFPDGSADVVIWQDAAHRSSWKGGRIVTDARAALVRLGADGRPVGGWIVGGTTLEYGGHPVVVQPCGVRRAKVEKADQGRIVLAGADGWPTGEAWRGRTVCVDFGGNRREAYQIERIERDGGRTAVVLEGAPFFFDHRGTVTAMRSGQITRANQFVGTKVQKGGQCRRYLAGSRIEFPAIGLSATLAATCCEVLTEARFEVAGVPDLEAAGVKTGMDFIIAPNLEGAVAEVVLDGGNLK